MLTKLVRQREYHLREEEARGIEEEEEEEVEGRPDRPTTTTRRLGTRLE